MFSIPAICDKRTVWIVPGWLRKWRKAMPLVEMFKYTPIEMKSYKKWCVQQKLRDFGYFVDVLFLSNSFAGANKSLPDGCSSNVAFTPNTYDTSSSMTLNADAWHFAVYLAFRVFDLHSSLCGGASRAPHLYPLFSAGRVGRSWCVKRSKRFKSRHFKRSKCTATALDVPPRRLWM